MRIKIPKRLRDAEECNQKKMPVVLAWRMVYENDRIIYDGIPLQDGVSMEDAMQLARKQCRGW